MKENTYAKLRKSLGLTGGVLILAGCLSGLTVNAAENNTVAEFTAPRHSLASTVEARKTYTATVTADTLNIRSGPGVGYAKTGMFTRGYQVEVIETKGDWSRVDGGWVASKYLTSSENHGINKGDTVVITAATLNVRQGAGTDYARVDHLNKGARAEILEVKDGWGKIKQGWISLKYASRVGGTTNNNTAGQDDGVIHAHKGDVAYVTADKLNIRTGPGTEYAKTGALTRGYRVEIIETKGGWARTEDGWIALKYLNIKSPENVQVDKGDVVRITAEVLNVREGPGTNYSRVGRIIGGSTEEILEVKNGWGKIKEGWISLNYVKYVKGSPSAVIQAGDTVKVTADWLNIRQGAGTEYARLDHLSRNTTVRITEIKDGWGKFDKGWISLNYVVKV